MKDFIQQILTIIGYSGDKELFITDFTQVCYQQAFAEYVNTLSEEDKSHLLQQLSTETDPDKQQHILAPHFAREIYEKMVQHTVVKMVYSYLEEIEPTLSTEQREALENFFTSNSSSLSS